MLDICYGRDYAGESAAIADELKECGLAKFVHDFYVYDVEGNCVER